VRLHRARRLLRDRILRPALAHYLAFGAVRAHALCDAGPGLVEAPRKCCRRGSAISSSELYLLSARAKRLAGRGPTGAIFAALECAWLVAFNTTIENRFRGNSPRQSPNRFVAVVLKFLGPAFRGLPACSFVPISLSIVARSWCL